MASSSAMPGVDPRTPSPRIRPSLRKTSVGPRRSRPSKTCAPPDQQLPRRQEVVWQGHLGAQRPATSPWWQPAWVRRVSGSGRGESPCQSGRFVAWCATGQDRTEERGGERPARDVRRRAGAAPRPVLHDKFQATGRTVSSAALSSPQQPSAALGHIAPEMSESPLTGGRVSVVPVQRNRCWSRSGLSMPRTGTRDCSGPPLPAAMSLARDGASWIACGWPAPIRLSSGRGAAVVGRAARRQLGAPSLTSPAAHYARWDLP